MKVVLNHIPPSLLSFPSPALSILKSFMNANGVETSVKYWNINMSEIMSYYSFDNDIMKPLLPFLTILADEYEDEDVKTKLLIALQTLQPFFRTKKDFYINSYQELQSEVFRVIEREINRTDFSDVKLWGFSSLFYQWISGLVIVKEVKKRYPDIKVVMGGFTDADSAWHLLDSFKEFDFAIWGEGEYPLLELARQLETDNPDFSLVPRLVYREGNETKRSGKAKSEMFDMNSGIFPDFDDYFAALKEITLDKSIPRVTVNSMRGCIWGKCKFCVYFSGSTFRDRTPQNIMDEIRAAAIKYDVNLFYFTDNDSVGSGVERFEKLLDLLIEYRKNERTNLEIYGEVILNPAITPTIFGKMKEAGFPLVYVGFEAVTDNLLRKMHKKNTLCGNICFVKNAIRKGIEAQTGIITDIPGETLEDVYESIQNLHLFRFFFNDTQVEFRLPRFRFKLYKQSEFFNTISEDEKAMHVTNLVVDHLPKTLFKSDDRLNYNSFWKPYPKFDNEWKNFFTIEQYYANNTFCYSIHEKNETWVYEEFLNSNRIISISFESKVYKDILKEVDDKILSFKNLFAILSPHYSELSEKGLENALIFLKTKQLIYYNEKLTEIISVLK